MKKKKLSLLWGYLQGSRGLLAFSLLSGTISTAAKLLIPFFAGKAINVLFDEAGNKDISAYLVLMGVLLVLGTAFRYLFDYLTYLVGQRVVTRMRTAVFASYMDANLSALDSHSEGDLTLRLMSDVENVNNGLVTGFASLYDGIISIVLTIAFMMSLNYILGFIVIVLTPISLLVSRFISKFNSKHYKRQGKQSGELQAFLSETLEGSESVYALGAEDERTEGFENINEAYREATFKANMGASIINPLTRLVNAIVNCAVLIVGALFIAGNWQVGIVFLVGDLSAFLTYASTYTQPFNEVSSVVSEIAYAVASFDRVSSAVDLPKESETGQEEILGKVASIAAKDVHFAYDDGKKEVIKGVSFALKEGQSAALVGPTGSGKTTIISLLMRFYDPQKGGFFLGEEAASSFPRKDLRARFGMVLQDTWIFDGTVRENIAYGKEDASLEEIKKAAQEAGASSFIDRLPNGYDTRIGNDSGLSKGERQLLSIARVILMDPEVVLLDEATSSIDVLTEKRLSASLERLLAGKTSLVVAHRLSTVEHSDLILVLDGGKIVESGTHASLLKEGGFYASLYQAQFE